MTQQETSEVKKNLRKRVRPLLLAGAFVFIVIELIALSPSSLEQTQQIEEINMNDLAVHDAQMKAKGIPKDQIPDYSIDQFQYVSTQGGRKQWKLFAERAHMYQSSRLVHALQVVAYLYDANEKITEVTGLEAKYNMDDRVLEIYDRVNTHFPDGFTVQSEYMKYIPQKRQVIIPKGLAVTGSGRQAEGHELRFSSLGMDYSLDQAKIILPLQVKVTMKKDAVFDENHKGVAEETNIISDSCEIDREKQRAYFEMNARRPMSQRFVKITQPDLLAQGRRAELFYGNYDHILNYLVLYVDVTFWEKGGQSRYGTGGIGEFNSDKNVIVLKEFPQVYQDGDTVTGDLITVYRDTDLVEVLQSNAFSSGEVNTQKDENGTDSSKANKKK